MNKNTIRRILITGGTSGIGFEAVLRLIHKNNIVIIPCRNKSRAKETINRLLEKNISKSTLDKLVSTPLVDLADLRSIDKYINQLGSNDITIDTLILNAGIQYTGAKNPLWSAQGIELTFAVNHLSHQYLTQKLIPYLDKSPCPRIVVTSSEVHNPQTPGGRIGMPANLGELSGIKTQKGFKMINGDDIFSADKAYKDSKLCNILFCRELVRLLSIRKSPMPVIAWAPGLVIPRRSGGFFRYSRKYNSIGQALFAFIARDLLRITESPENAGNILCNISTEDDFKLNGFTYFSNTLEGFGKKNFKKSVISKEALDDELATNLWNSCAELANIDKELTHHYE